MRLGASLKPQNPQVYSVRGFEAFLPWLEPWVACLSCSPIVPPSLSACKCGTTLSTSCHLASSPFCPAAHLLSSYRSGCFFFNSLVVRLPYSSIFCQFWLFFVFKFVVILLLVVWVGTVYLHLHLGQKSQLQSFKINNKTCLLLFGLKICYISFTKGEFTWLCSISRKPCIWLINSHYVFNVNIICIFNNLFALILVNLSWAWFGVFSS